MQLIIDEFSDLEDWNLCQLSGRTNHLHSPFSLLVVLNDAQTRVKNSKRSPVERITCLSELPPELPQYPSIRLLQNHIAKKFHIWKYKIKVHKVRCDVMIILERVWLSSKIKVTFCFLISSDNFLNYCLAFKISRLATFHIWPPKKKKIICILLTSQCF